MSIINDALKKADHRKKWKTFSKMVTPDEAFSVAQAEIPPSVIEEIKTSVRPPGAPPFHIRFQEPSQPAKIHSFPPAFKVILAISVICGLFVLALGMWLYFWTGGPSFSHPFQSTASAPAVQVPPVVQPKPAAPVAEAKPQFKPYQKPAAAKPAVRPISLTLRQPPIESHYHLTGISVLPDSNRVAIINGKVLAVGDMTEDAQVVAIKDNVVRMKKGDREFVLTII